MDIAKIISSIGLLCDIGGAILIWKYGLPNRITKLEFWETIPHPPNWNTDIDKNKVRKYARLSKWGLFLLIFGFTLQLVSNFVDPSIILHYDMLREIEEKIRQFWDVNSVKAGQVMAFSQYSR